MTDLTSTAVPPLHLSRRGVFAAAAGGVLVSLAGAYGWGRFDLRSRLFNPFTRENFDLAPVAGVRLGSGAPAPGFSAGDLKGQVTVLNFWASTCTACVGELADLQKVSAEFAGRADVIGIDVSDDAAAARQVTRQAGTGYRLAVDADGSLAGRYRIFGLPYTVILDPTGRVVIRHPGSFTAEQLEYVLDSLLPPAP